LNNFLFNVTKYCSVIGYDIYDHRKQIVNYKIDEGFYLAFYERDENETLEEDLIFFIYNYRVLMIRKKVAVERKI
jgi:hypothetical protein